MSSNFQHDRIQYKLVKNKKKGPDCPECCCFIDSVCKANFICHKSVVFMGYHWEFEI